MNRSMPRATKRNAWAILCLSFALLLALVVIPPVFDLRPPLDSAEAVQSQREPSSCEAVADNWTSCDSAASSDDIYAVASDGRGPAQFARPDADLSIVNWTDSAGDGINYTKINEVVPDDDGNYSESPTEDVGSDNDDAEFGLSTVSDPMTSAGHILRYRYRNSGDNGGNARIDLVVELKQGNTVIANWPTPDIRDITYFQENQTLTAAEADSITDYTDLGVRFNMTFTSGSQTRQFRLTWAEFEVPGPLLPGKNDTAWFDFGYDLSPAETLAESRLVLSGIEPVLNLS